MSTKQTERQKVAKMKQMPVDELIKDKDLLFVDDSIVRGTQLRDTVGRLYRRGAKEIHMRSSCPPLLFGCRFLNFSRSRSELDLAARRAIARLENGDTSDATIKQYLEYGSPKYNAMVDEIRKELNLTSLKFQKLESLIRSMGLPADKVCTYCWNGRDVNDEVPDFD